MLQDKQMRIVIRISILIFIILIIFLIYNLAQNSRINIEKEKTPTLSLTTDSNIFKLESILLYSSADATSNLENPKDYWDINLYQYTDISLNINNNVSIDGSTQKNTVKQMYIDNIHFPKMPDKGSPALYYKDSDSFGIGKIDDTKLISDRININIVDSNNAETSSPSFYPDCSDPLLLSAVNKDIVKNYIIRNTNSVVTFDGSLLVDALVLLSNIEYEVSFSIHIINYLDEEYVCNVSIPIVLSDENDINSIYDGSFQVTYTDLSSNRFYKVEE